MGIVLIMQIYPSFSGWLFEYLQSQIELVVVEEEELVIQRGPACTVVFT